jgi:hypothetical protein
MRFELTENHIKLLNRMSVYFEKDAYDGAPAIDIKRPYGNSSVAYDIYEILNGKPFDSDEDMPDEICEALIEIHKQTATALQVVLDTMAFTPGVYEKEQYGGRWKLTKRAGMKSIFISGISDDGNSYYVKPVAGHVVGHFYCEDGHLTAEQAKIAAQAAANALNALILEEVK